MLSKIELNKLIRKCKNLPKGSDYRMGDYIEIIMNTVLDFQMNPKTLNSAEKHFKDCFRKAIRDYNSLVNLLDRFPNTKKGNLRAANLLWGNNHWTRIEFLRKLLSYLGKNKITTFASLKKWARTADFDNDIKGNIKTKYHSIGFALFKWLQIKVGVDTVKPDVHVKRFFESAIGRKPTNKEVVDTIDLISTRLKRERRELDAAIWDQKGQ